MSELSSLRLGQDEDMRGRLPWYRHVADNVMPAKFRIARHVAVEVSLADASTALEVRTPRSRVNRSYERDWQNYI